MTLISLFATYVPPPMRRSRSLPSGIGLFLALILVPVLRASCDLVQEDGISLDGDHNSAAAMASQYVPTDLALRALESGAGLMNRARWARELAESLDPVSHQALALARLRRELDRALVSEKGPSASQLPKDGVVLLYTPASLLEGSPGEATPPNAEETWERAEDEAAYVAHLLMGLGVPLRGDATMQKYGRPIAEGLDGVSVGKVGQSALLELATDMAVAAGARTGLILLIPVQAGREVRWMSTGLTAQAPD